MSKLKTLLIATTLMIVTTACSYVDPGEVGIIVNSLGEEKGVELQVKPTGRYWLTPNESLYTFPTFSQNYVWTASDTEGSEDNESLSFQTIEGMSVNADVGVTYAIDPDKVPTIFQKYRRGVDEITDTYLRNMVRDALVDVASKLKMEQVYGPGKTAIIRDVEARVRDQVANIGINVERIYWVGDLRLPKRIVEAIEAKNAATQMTIQRRNEVEQSKAEADKKIEEARGHAESLRLTSIAEAESIRVRGEALQDNPGVIQLSAIKKWDGILPRINGTSAVPFINLDKAAQ